MPKTATKEAQNPLILRALRLIEAFAKSDDERDFYLDRQEGFIVFVDLNKSDEAIENLEKELTHDRYCHLPKLSFYETKKIMESFVNEKVYDIDTKEKLIDIIQSKEARENFLEFIYDQHTELDKWQQFYQERSRIRIIEWLRHNHFHFVFEEDLELSTKVVEQLKEHLFDAKVGKELTSARKTLTAKAKTYYSNEALNPRPKRGRPPKQNTKQDVETETSADIYLTVPATVRPFLFIPDISGISAATFSAKYESEEELLKSLKTSSSSKERWNHSNQVKEVNRSLSTLRTMTKGWNEEDESGNTPSSKKQEAVAETKEPIKKRLRPKKSAQAAASPKKKMALKVKRSAEEKKTVQKKTPLRSIIKKEKPTPNSSTSKKKPAAKSTKAATKKRIIPKTAEQGKKTGPQDYS